MKIMHCEYKSTTANKNLVLRQAITEEHYRRMTSEGDLKWWGARVTSREYTPIGLVPTRIVRHRWGDKLKVIDTFSFLPDDAEVVEFRAKEW